MGGIGTDWIVSGMEIRASRAGSSSGDPAILSLLLIIIVASNWFGEVEVGGTACILSDIFQCMLLRQREQVDGDQGDCGLLNESTSLCEEKIAKRSTECPTQKDRTIDCSRAI